MQAVELAREIIRCSGAMPDPEKHLRWLGGLREEVLRERLRVITSQPAYAREHDNFLKNAYDKINEGGLTAGVVGTR